MPMLNCSSCELPLPKNLGIIRILHMVTISAKYPIEAYQILSYDSMNSHLGFFCLLVLPLPLR